MKYLIWVDGTWLGSYCAGLMHPSRNTRFCFRLVLCTVAVGCVLGAAHAQTAATETERGNDALLKLVIERGLVPPLEAAVEGVRQARSAASDVVFSALNHLGVRYRRGGSSADEGFDCSGFVRYVVNNTFGLVLPRRSDEQAASSNVVPVSKSELQPGDLVFFNTLRSAFSHVGIYIGDGKFVHSPRSGFAVRVEDMQMDYWVKRFDGARRLVPMLGNATPAGVNAATAPSPGVTPQP
jgi:hypothetical protein